MRSVTTVHTYVLVVNFFNNHHVLCTNYIFEYVKYIRRRLNTSFSYEQLFLILLFDMLAILPKRPVIIIRYVYSITDLPYRFLSFCRVGFTISIVNSFLADTRIDIVTRYS